MTGKPPSFQLIANNNDLIPGSDATFRSYNQPSLNAAGTVVFRARGSSESGQPLSGNFLGSFLNSALKAVAVRGDTVPDPNNTEATFKEFPAFPRIDRNSEIIAFRGQSNPTYQYEDARIGTSGIYSNPGNILLSGANQLGVTGLSNFSFYSVPGTEPGTHFDQFPGAPSPSQNFIAFKGNWTAADGSAQTGIYYRDLVAADGRSPVQLIADSNTSIPDLATNIEFGSTAPPSAAQDKIVFLGVDNEAAPSAGGIYLADLKSDPNALQTIVGLGSLSELVGDPAGLINIGEVLSFDGRLVSYWGSWGDEVSYQLIACPTDGNQDLLDYCMQLSKDGEQGGIGQGNDGKYYFLKPIASHQGIFVSDTITGETELITSTAIAESPATPPTEAATAESRESFIFFNFSGRPPSAGEGDSSTSEEDDLELARWRSSAFMAVDGSDLAYKAATLTPIDLGSLGFDQPEELAGHVWAESGQAIDYQDLDALTPPVRILSSTDDGGDLDPSAAGLPITALGLERDSLRQGKLAFAASMASDQGDLEVDTWAGIYGAKLNNDFKVVTGAGSSGGPHVRIFSSLDGNLEEQLYAYDPQFKGGVRVVQAQLDGDGIHDRITAAGPGGGPHVQVFSGASGELIRSFYAYDPAFKGGVNIAAGDIDDDGIDDVVTGAGSGGGPHVRVFSGASGELIRNVYAYDPAFNGGVTVAAGDIDGDGIDDVITGAGSGGGPHVRAFSGASGELIRNFYAYDPAFNGGVNVAVHDLDGDHIGEILTGAGPGGGPHVKAFSTVGEQELLSFYAYEPAFAGGVFVG